MPRPPRKGAPNAPARLFAASPDTGNLSTARRLPPGPRRPAFRPPAVLPSGHPPPCLPATRRPAFRPPAGCHPLPVALPSGLARSSSPTFTATV